MKLATYLVNSTNKEYVLIGMDYPSKVGTFLGSLEKYSKWDLRKDNIYVWQTSTLDDYKDVAARIYNECSIGGEVIHEFINLYDLKHL
jgi:hypothetical protein